MLEVYYNSLIPIIKLNYTISLFDFSRRRITIVYEVRKCKNAKSYVAKTNHSITADACSNFFPARAVLNTKKNTMKEPGLFKEEFRCIERLCLCSKTYCFYDSLGKKFKFNSKELKE